MSRVPRRAPSIVEHRIRLATSEAHVARARRWREAVERGDSAEAARIVEEMSEADRVASEVVW